MEINLLTEGLDINAVPEKFKDMQSGAVNVPALLNSYKELERKMSGQSKAPASAEEYCIECKHGMFTPDRDVKGMMRDPKYWRDKDPAFVAKVTDGFKKIYKD